MPQMLPNAAVQGVLILCHPPIAQNVPKGLDQLARIGFAAFNTALDDKYLGVAIAPSARSLCHPWCTATRNRPLARPRRSSRFRVNLP